MQIVRRQMLVRPGYPKGTSFPFTISECPHINCKMGTIIIFLFFYITFFGVSPHIYNTHTTTGNVPNKEISNRDE